MKTTKLLGAIAAVLLLSACSSGTPAPASPIGTWGEEKEGEPLLVLEDGGKVSGTDGCNRLMGSWSESDGTITFGALASTRMMCEGVDVWLSDAASAKLDNGALTIEDAAGEKIGTLQRTK